MHKLKYICVTLLVFVLIFSLMPVEGLITLAAAAAPAVSVGQIDVDDGFWSSWQKVMICESIPAGIKNVETAAGGLPNIKNAAKKHRGESYGAFQGAPWMDSDSHKLIEAMSYALLIDAEGDADIINAQAAIKAKLEEWIPYYIDAQMPDGYVDTYYILDAEPYSSRFTNLGYNHELYISGHLYEAAVAYYNATKDTRLLDIAVKNADLIAKTFGDKPGQYKQVPGHQEIELALVKLAALCRQIGGGYSGKADSYIALAQFFLDTRGDYANRYGKGIYQDSGLTFNAQYNQDHLPVEEQTVAVGHAVRACYMYSAMTDMELLSGSGKYDKALKALWEDINTTKTYVTGGIGSGGNEGFTAAYDLPNDTAYCETCANVANAQWNLRMNQLYQQSKYMDVAERDFYNCILSGVNFDGDKFFYTNTLESSGTVARAKWYGTACCPPNLMRIICSIGDYIYAAHDDGLAVNLYIGNQTQLKVNNTAVKLTLTTDMPWDSHNTVTVDPASPVRFALKLRLPEWTAGEATVSINGKAIPVQADVNGYIILERTWSKGDIVKADFPMEAERAYSDEKVTSNLGSVAIKRGPVVYAAEQPDNDYTLGQYVLPTTSALTVEKVDNLDGRADPYHIKSMNLITTKANIMGGGEATLTLIPYYAWNNRGVKAMKVYIPEWKAAGALEANATPLASAVSIFNSIDSLNDGVDAHSIPNAWTSYGTAPNPWVEYDFSFPVTLTGCQIRWFDDGGGVQVPDSFTILYWNGSAFVPVDSPTGTSVMSKNAYDTYTFEAVTTQKIRIQIKNDIKNVASGMWEWKLIGSVEDDSLKFSEIRRVMYGGKPFDLSYDDYNVADFEAVTTTKLRLVTQSIRPIGIRELQIRSTSGQYIEGSAQAFASYSGAGGSLAALNNGNTSSFWTSYPYYAEQYVEYRFNQPVTVNSAKIYWYWNDLEILLPQSYMLYYEDNGVWKPVRDAAENVNFNPDKQEYTLYVDQGARVPLLTVESAGGNIEITQTASLPGKATLKDKSTGKVYTFNFEYKTEEPVYTVTVRTTEGGSVYPYGTLVVAKGESRAFDLVAESGYELSAVKVNGKRYSTASAFNLTNIQADSTVDISFVKIGSIPDTGGNSILLPLLLAFGASLTVLIILSLAQKKSQGLIK